MNSYRFILEPYKGIKSRFKCPNCYKIGVFTKYIDLETNEYLHESVGICDRINKCGYHYPPKDYLQVNDISLNKVFTGNERIQSEVVKRQPSFIDEDIFDRSQKEGSTNYFLDYLSHLWNPGIALSLAERYNIGSSKHWQGGTVFWQMDINNKIRSGKIMLYDPKTGKRVKKPFNHITWAHKVLKLEDFNLKQCLFGEHLLNEDEDKPVAIVESEKTAIIASVFLPEFIWMSCGSVNNLTEEKTRVLKGRSVILFPDLGCYDIWNDKIPSLTKLASFRVSDLIETKASPEEKLQGLDIADYLIGIKKSEEMV
ncbi:DUF6371 domain-containing protein [Aestuariibaculum sp. M13]|uniref:DUF6371 domain-containing protein n=1 Tax=Aestuariibaculum sp. M13 TaxID=2967132 RepID=UPI002159E27A|nr:DUF6371 domain-containing protein [Aestuariibaculum sp. M13]MCR8667893.1 DUF6371 domain-containing protein [Aestuariibaculum sp. M13]